MLLWIMLVSATKDSREGLRLKAPIPNRNVQFVQKESNVYIRKMRSASESSMHPGQRQFTQPTLVQERPALIAEVLLEDASVRELRMYKNLAISAGLVIALLVSNLVYLGLLPYKRDWRMPEI